MSWLIELEVVIFISYSIYKILQLVLSKRWKNDRGASIPSRWHLPRFACVWTMYSLFQSKTSNTDIPLPPPSIYRLPFLTFSRVVITDPEVARELFSKHETSLIRRPDFGCSWVLAEILGNCLFAQHGEAWKSLIKSFKSFYFPGRAKEQINDTARVCMVWMEKFLASHNQLLSMNDLFDVPFEMVARSVFGADLSLEDMQTLKNFSKDVDKLTGSIFTKWEAAFPFFKWLPTSFNRELQIYRKKWTEFCRRKILDAKNSSTPSIVGTLVTSQSVNLPESVLHETLCEIVLANADFVAAAVMWPLVFLAKFPKEKALVQDELKRVMLDSTGGSKAWIDHINEGKISDFLDQLPYLESVLWEAWRLEPMMVVTNPVVLSEDTFLNGFLIPEGSHVVIDTKTLNRNPHTFSKPDEFHPSRMLQRSSLKPSSMHVFGLGSRRCLGQHYAITLCKLMIASVLLHFDLALPKEGLPTKETSYGPFEFPNAPLLLITRS